jgi:hypothetical protein
MAPYKKLNMADPYTKGYKTDSKLGFVSQIPYEELLVEMKF